MAVRNPRKTKALPNGILGPNPVLKLGGLLACVIVLSLLIFMTPSGQSPVKASALAMIAGLVYESKRLSTGWKPLLFGLTIAFALSFIAFMPGRREYDYNVEDHIEMWPYVFMGIFIVGSIAFHGDKVTPKLTEGISLLQSIAIGYWVIAHDLIQPDSPFLLLFVVLILLFSVFVGFHAFTHSTLFPSVRLTLSVGSSIIMLLFAVDDIISVHQQEEIELAVNIGHGFYIGLQYFLLGVSSIYIVQNFLMLVGFLPDRNRLFNKAYKRDLRVLKQEHITRYSHQQVDRAHSFICVVFAGTVFSLNHMLQLVPAHVAIWTVFVLFPFVLPLYDAMRGQKPAVN